MGLTAGSFGKWGEMHRVIESGNPLLNVDELMQRVRDEVARHRYSSLAGAADQRVLGLRGNVNLSAIESWIAIADQKARARTKWPSHLRVFPFSASERLRGLALSLLAFLFKDQRHVNEALIGAFRESVTLNRHLVEQLQLLRERVAELEQRLGSGQPH
jgi:hypothetical protein